MSGGVDNQMRGVIVIAGVLLFSAIPSFRSFFRSLFLASRWTLAMVG
jgi:hypothetical protein